MINRSISLTIENIFYVTLRNDADSNYKNCKDICSDEFLSSSNISEIICSRLSREQEMGGAITYLASSYKRLQLKLSSSNDKIKEELIKYIYFYNFFWK